MSFSDLLDKFFRGDSVPLLNYNPIICEVGSNCVALGIGRKETDAGGVIIKHKVKSGGGKEALSTQVVNASVDTINYWREKISDPFNATYYVEDISPDTSLALVLFIARVSGLSVDEVPADWIDYVQRWEDGEVKTTGEAFHSWGCLHNALAHVHFNVITNTSSVVPLLEPNSFNKGFISCLRLLTFLIKQRIDPSNVPEINHLEEYCRAITLLRYEYQHHLYTISRSTTFQLQLPIVDSNRTLLVDAMLSSESKYLGASKAFLRNDKVNSWLKSGFVLMALYRPELKGSGNDIVISVDPSMKVHLRDFWSSLEEMENDRWGDSRPCDNPRMPERSQANQPWWDDEGKYTLVAAPKMLNDNVHGSKLTWDDVVSVLWKLYNPAKDLMARAYTENGALSEAKQVHECSPLLKDIENKIQFTALKWHSNGLESFVLSPTMTRYLAAVATGQFSHMPMLYDLPPEMSFDFFELPGGFCIIHPNGVLILDDWSHHEVQMNECLSEFKCALSRVDTIRKTYKVITRYVNAVREKISGDSLLSTNELMELNQRMARFKTDLRSKMLETISTSTDYNLQYFRKTLEQRLGLNTQLDELYQTVAEIDNVIRSYSETRTNRVISFITIYGFPLIFFGGLFQFVIAQAGGPKWHGIHIYGAIAFVVLSGAGMLGLNFILKRLFKPHNKELNI